MDRRIKKSRAAIYQAFIHLLNQQHYDTITVQQIIDLADVGRSTFYSHFESKEMLLEEVCEDLFAHSFAKPQAQSDIHGTLAHIFYHFKHNQDKVATLLLSNNLYFTKRLKTELHRYVFPLVRTPLIRQKQQIPESFLEHFVSTTFIETINWWLQQRQLIDEQTIASYFLEVIGSRSPYALDQVAEHQKS
ncbi:TetR/AcrR family transcriptional regulator [Streptococcus acidominimus]|uniref:TetR/AcrR family transcriptional regulator n=1 Tax=Streptococcus acidominimus TaxID=1326 RepID=A0A4Y9FMW0_STRAI|nr:TetR/AcrR family transcriptional regulator [Streptococcus acidominimus]MBF0818992.1 TetR/AcrR family transcriptional regulator [Streptococcus acidominimus]MBF0839292.1 TetR/AcrR family transcriptional regulator [Streptococcus acidominimus]MBF0847038.1 TetR/AcrR family transcriptional regulator [Streptococcus danieliae]TFU30501.1 TetR/AcrR family transcriptional regulator [Streptococcus acidominimus]